MPKGFKKSKYPHLYPTEHSTQPLEQPVLAEQKELENEQKPTPYSEDYGTFSLKIEEADDVVPPARKTLKDRAKAFAAKLTGEIEETEATVSKPKRARKGQFWQQKSPLFVGAGLALLSWALPGMTEAFEVDGEVKTLAPTKQQATDIILPLLRIVDRHTNVNGVHPDVADAIESAIALTTYGFEARANLLLLKMIKEQEYAKAKKNGESGHDAPTRQTTVLNGNYESDAREQAITW